MSLSSIEFSGTIFVNTHADDDYIGFIFGYQDSSTFYTVQWKQKNQTYWHRDPTLAEGTTGMQIKVCKCFLLLGHVIFYMSYFTLGNFKLGNFTCHIMEVALLNKTNALNENFLELSLPSTY